MHLAESAFGDVDRGVFSSRGDWTVSAEVLGAGGQRITGSQIRPLEAPHLGFGDASAQPGILTWAFCSAPPARVAGDVQHGSEGHGETVARAFLCSFARSQRPGLRIEQPGLSEGDRKQSAMAVNDVQPDQERDAKARCLDRQTLHFVRRPGADHVQQVADCARSDGLCGVPGDDGPSHGIGRGRHGQLTQFFRQRHLAQQLLDPGHPLIPRNVRTVMINGRKEITSTADDSHFRRPFWRTQGDNLRIFTPRR